MKKASELYEALWKVDEKLGDMARIILRLGTKAENIKNLSEIKGEVSTREYGETIDDSIETYANIAIEEITDLEVTIAEARKISLKGLEEQEAEEGDAPQDEAGTKEDKQRILDMFWHTLKETRAGEDVSNLVDNQDGTMTIYFCNGAMKKVNIEGDSGIAMIVDVCRALM